MLRGKILRSMLRLDLNLEEIGTMMWLERELVELYLSGVRL